MALELKAGSERRLRLLDLFCGAGGAAMGYHRAGFDVVGVDIKPQPHYPFEFVHGDAMRYLEDIVENPLWPRIQFGRIDAIHASPPCQPYIRSSDVFRRTTVPDYLPRTRDLLKGTGLPWVIENVPGAPMRPDYELCGAMFGLRAGGRNLYRHRWFETSWRESFFAPSLEHDRHTLPALGVYGHPRGNAKWGGGTFAEQKRAMEIDWMTSAELAQAVPPIYTFWIGQQLSAQVKVAA